MERASGAMMLAPAVNVWHLQKNSPQHQCIPKTSLLEARKISKNSTEGRVRRMLSARVLKSGVVLAELAASAFPLAYLFIAYLRSCSCIH